MTARNRVIVATATAALAGGLALGTPAIQADALTPAAATHSATASPASAASATKSLRVAVLADSDT
ncbi:hypothetical protein AB0F45_38630, partial [Streptomyces achromogenes]|uniref:hypothetical protein n=1 Tax=Streptomyces achromogenes TaxID=67255 RepID=UPI0033E98FC1